MSRFLLIPFALVLAAGCGDDSQGPSKPPPASTSHKKVVEVRNNFFSPIDVTIARGDTVVWFNAGSAGHTTTSGAGCSADGLWDSGGLASGESYSVIFGDNGVTQTGTMPYYCVPHCGMGMTGTVTVSP